jgi:hypothetical protein
MAHVVSTVRDKVYSNILPSIQIPSTKSRNSHLTNPPVISPKEKPDSGSICSNSWQTKFLWILYHFEGIFVSLNFVPEFYFWWNHMSNISNIRADINGYSTDHFIDVRTRWVLAHRTYPQNRGYSCHHFMSSLQEIALPFPSDDIWVTVGSGMHHSAVFLTSFLTYMCPRSH